MKVARGTWVEIESVVLEPGERAPGLPEDTAATPYVLRLSGFLEEEAEVGASVTVKSLIGRTHRGVLRAVNSAFHLTSAHDMSLQNAMEMGRRLGADLPEEITIVGVSASQVYDFSEELSPPVQSAVPKMTAIVVEFVTQNITIL